MVDNWTEIATFDLHSAHEEVLFIQNQQERIKVHLTIAGYKGFSVYAGRFNLSHRGIELFQYFLKCNERQVAFDTHAFFRFFLNQPFKQ